MLKADIDRDLKTAMLARDKRLVDVLRFLKSAILYKEVADGKREAGLDDESAITVLKKERKSRRDASELYRKAEEKTRAEEEEYQIEVIERYLPEEISEKVVADLVKNAIIDMDITSPEMKDVGKIIGAVKRQNSSVDGAVISKIIKRIINGE